MREKRRHTQRRTGHTPNYHNRFAGLDPVPTMGAGRCKHQTAVPLHPVITPTCFPEDLLGSSRAKPRDLKPLPINNAVPSQPS